jgi:hypothetical protein
MRHRRRASLTPFLFAVLLALAASAASAGECPYSGNSYIGTPYASPIGLPRCIGSTVPKWSVCEVCLISKAPFSNEQDPYTMSYPASGPGLQPRATFTQNGTPLPPVDGFFDGLTNGTTGQAIFRIRFTPTIDSGTIVFSTTSSDAGLTISPTSFPAGSPSASDKGFLRRDPSYPRTFVWDDGTHPFLWGQTFYQIIDHARTGIDTLWQPSIVGSSNYKMNKVRLLVSPWGGDPRYVFPTYSPPADSQAFQKDSSMNLILDKLDIEHWRALDRVTSFLKAQTMIADLILFRDNAGGAAPSIIGTTAQNQRYTRYTVARYGAFTNVIWTLANEYQNIAGTNNSTWDDLGCVIRGCGNHSPGADPWIVNGSSWRPLSIHNNINADNTSYPCFEFFLSSWPTDVVLQTKRADGTTDQEVGGAVQTNSNPAYRSPPCPGLAGSPRLPVIDDEYYYIETNRTDAQADRDVHREASWAIAASGGFGSTGDLHGPPGCLHGNNDNRCSPALYTVWVDEGDPYKDIRNLIDYFTQPVNGLSNIWWQMTASAGLTMVETTRVYGLEGAGQHVVYAVHGPGSGPKAKFKVSLPAGRYTSVFTDPTNVASAAASQEKRVTSISQAASAVPTPFASPRRTGGWSDWVARIIRRGSGGRDATDETVWVWDDLPDGAVAGGDSESWNWVDDEPAAISDSLAHQSNLVAGMHQHYFQSATETLSIGAGDWLYAYVYLDPLNPPSEVMLQWNDGTWDHRAYWGANQIIVWGTDGTISRRYMGPLPLTDQWVRLEVPASAVGLEGHTLNGMAFTLYDGKATWDEAGRAGASVPQCQDSAITLQPQSQTIVPGASATLSVAVSGTGPFNYQFYQAPVGGYQNPTGISTATINTGPLYATKQYWAEIDDTCQGIFLHSDAATITVQCTAAPAITQQPASRVTTPGQSTTLSVSATQGVSYQWYQGATAITGAINATLTVAPQSTAAYWVRVTNGCGTADSVTATVCVLPAITVQPTPRTINPGQSTTLTVSAINAATYQWYVGTAPSTATPAGGNSSSLLASPIATTNYWVRVSNSCGAAGSTTVTVTVAPPPPPQITRIQSVSILANSQQSLIGRWTQPTQPGTFLVAVVSGLKDPAALEWTAPAGWQLAVVNEWPNVKVAIYYLANNAGARTSETFTVQQGYHDMTLYMIEYSGMMAVSPLDRTASSGDLTNNGNVQTGVTANTVQRKELVITGLSTYTQTAFTVNPTDGYTEIYDQYMLFHLTTAMYEKITTSIGSYGHAATVSVPAEWAGVVATFRGADTN